VKYPEEIKVGLLEYSSDNYNKYVEVCYRIGNNLYVYREETNKVKEILLQKGTVEFSLILQHLILKAFKNSYNEKGYRIEDTTKRLNIIRKEPSIKTEYVEVFEKVEIQTLHWQDVNFGVIVDYSTRNNFTERFASEKLNRNAFLPHPSYSNFYKYLGYEEAKNIMAKIADLRGEKAFGKMRSDALNQRMLKIKEFLKDCLGWNEANQEKELSIPTGKTIIVSTKNVEVVLLSGKEEAYE